MARMRRRQPAEQAAPKKIPSTVQTHRPALELEDTVRLMCSKPAYELKGIPTIIRNKLKTFSADARPEKAVIVKQIGIPTGSMGRVVKAIQSA